MKKLDIIAGHQALKMLDQGLDPKSRITMMAGAAGGPKWLGLAAMDKIILRHMVPHFTAPVPAFGSSVGSWRMCYYARSNPIEIIDNFVETYLSWEATGKVTRESLSSDTRDLFDILIGDTGMDEILNHPLFHVAAITIRAKHLTETEHHLPLGLGSLLSAAANGLSRNSLKYFYDRVVFHDPRLNNPLPGWDDQAFQTERYAITRENFRQVFMASASIPMMFEGIRDIAGAPPGMYRDGGLIDYHMDLPYNVGGEEFVLMPHFSRHVHTGWFDKYMPARKGRPDRENMKNVLLVAPSQGFLDSLPYGKIPDRNDFRKMSDQERRDYWRVAVDKMQDVAEELENRIAKNDWGAFAEPFPA